MLVLGSAKLVGNTVSLSPPEGGFGGIKACRIANYTGDVLIITNVNSEQPGQQYLMPYQQDVYSIQNVRQPPQIQGTVLGTTFPTSSVLIEWSTEPLDDFPGTYPTALTQAAILAVAPVFEVHELAVPDDGTTYSIPADGTRLSLTFINDGAADLKWNYRDSVWASAPILAAGSGRTVDTQDIVYFRGNGLGASLVQYWLTRYGS